MDERPTHAITITVASNYQHGPAPVATLTMHGDGSIDHFCDAFQAALVAAGFTTATAGTLRVSGDE